MSDPIAYPDSQGPLVMNIVADEEADSADTLIQQESVYKNLTAMATAIAGVQQTGTDYVLHGLQFIWSTGLDCTLKTGLALSTQGAYYSSTGSWAFVANSGGSGNCFSVFNPTDNTQSFTSHVSSSSAIICTVEVAPSIVENELLSRQIWNSGTGSYSAQNVYTRYNFGVAVNINPGSATQAPAHTAGYIKIAEVTLAQSAVAITQADIVDWQHSELWTNEASATVWAGTSQQRSVSITASYTIPSTNTPAIILATGGAAGITVTLPSLAEVPSREFLIVKTDSAAGVITIVPQGTDTIAGITSFELSAQFQTASLHATSSSFLVRGTSQLPTGATVAAWTASSNSTYTVGLNTRVLNADPVTYTTVIQLPSAASYGFVERLYIRNKGTSTGTLAVTPATGDALAGITNGTWTITQPSGWLEIECDGAGWAVVSAIGSLYTSEISSTQSQASPGSTTWYNLGGSVALPPGIYRLRYSAVVQVVASSAVQILQCALALSPNAGAPSDPDLVTYLDQQVSAASSDQSILALTCRGEKTVVLSASTTYYLIAQGSSSPASLSTLALEYGGNYGSTRIEAERIG